MAKNRAVIWDMDGVIVDTAPYHLQAWQEVFRQRGVNFTAEQFHQSFGQRNDRIIRKTLGEKISPLETEAMAEEKEKGFRRRITQARHLKPLPGVLTLMTALREHGFKMALASSGPRENIQLLMRTLGVDGYLESIVAGRDVAESKPSPQIFLLAAEKLGVAPVDCIVIEDSIAGVAAAKRAGMHCLAVTTTHPRQSLAQADLIADTLESVSVSELEGLLISASRLPPDTRGG